MNSDYCYSVELTRALERHKSGEARVLPIILRPVHWQDVLGKIQALPKDGKPVIGPDWYSIDNALFNVAEGIIKAVKAVEDIQKKATQNIPPPQNPLQDAPQSMASQQFIPPYPIPPPTQGNANRQVNVNQRRRRFLIVVGTMIGLVLTAFGVLVFMLSAYDTTHYVYYITEFVVGTIFIGIGAVIFCKSAVAMIGRYTAIFFYYTRYYIIYL